MFEKKEKHVKCVIKLYSLKTVQLKLYSTVLWLDTDSITNRHRQSFTCLKNNGLYGMFFISSGKSYEILVLTRR